MRPYLTALNLLANRRDVKRAAEDAQGVLDAVSISMRLRIHHSAQVCEFITAPKALLDAVDLEVARAPPPPC